MRKGKTQGAMKKHGRETNTLGKHSLTKCNIIFSFLISTRYNAQNKS
jgi:hypothetical protein